MANDLKRKALTIGTHNGTFHCDEALGCFLLSKTEKYKDADVVRSRDPAVLANMDVVIDVGGVYEPSNNRFDHHQRGFDEAFGHGYVTKLSSAGLVYKHYGKEIIARYLNLPVEDPSVEVIWLQGIYRHQDTSVSFAAPEGAIMGERTEGAYGAMQCTRTS
jgi:uncharacterized UPF0160 family protein